MREYRDRDAAKDSDPYTDGWTPIVLALVVLNVLAYVAELLLARMHVLVPAELFDRFAFVPEHVARDHHFFQVVTYAFLHDPANPLHLLVNLFLIYIAGRELELELGKLRFLGFYLVAASLGALVYGAVTLSLGEEAQIPMLGASGAAMALLVVHALRHPTGKLPVLFLVDVPMWAGVALLVALDLAMALRLSPSHWIPAACHLAGPVFGLAYGRWGGRAETLPEPPRAAPARVVEEPAPAHVAAPNRGVHVVRVKNLEDEMDTVLRKVHASGLSSLSDEEKSVLDRASLHYREKK